MSILYRSTKNPLQLPGAGFDFRCSDPGVFAVTGVYDSDHDMVVPVFHHCFVIMQQCPVCFPYLVVIKSYMISPFPYPSLMHVNFRERCDGCVVLLPEG